MFYFLRKSLLPDCSDWFASFLRETERPSLPANDFSNPSLFMKNLTWAAVAAMLIGAIGPAAGEVVIKNGDSIAFLGDSITYLGASQKPNGYVNLVMEGLKQAGVNAVSIPAGVGGNTAQDMLTRLGPDVIAKKPVWLALNSGTNDVAKLSVEEFAEKIAAIVDEATAANIKVILMTTTASDSEKPATPDGQKRLQFCEEFRRLARARNLPLVDLRAVMDKELAERNPEGKGLCLTYDGTHLNGLGNQIVAAEILRTMGVSDADIAVLRQRWNEYPFAVGQPAVSINVYKKLQEAAAQKGQSVDQMASSLLTDSVK